jgi:hypothetical protein
VSEEPAWAGCHIPEDCFLHSHRRENLKSYIVASDSRFIEFLYN